MARKNHINDTPLNDSFGRLRVSNPITQFDSQLRYDVNSLLWNTDTIGTGSISHLPNESSVRLTVSALNDRVIHQSKEYFRYQAGKSLQILMTMVMEVAATGVQKCAGYFDDENGIFLQQNGETVSWVLRSNVSGTPVDTEINQQDWNIDVLHSLDLSKAQIVIIDLQWLGVGRVRVGFVIDGLPVYVHEFLHSNNSDSAYMTTAVLPIRYQITRTSGSGSASMKQICSTVTVEGGSQDSGLPFGASSGPAGATVTFRKPVFSVRPKTTFNSITNRGTINIEYIDILVTGNNSEIKWELIQDGTLAGDSFASVDDSSIAEYDVSASGILGGRVVRTGFIASGQAKAGQVISKIEPKPPLTLDISGVMPDVLTLVATPLVTTSKVYVGANWGELK